MDAIVDTEDVLRIPYDGVAFRKHAQTVRDVRDEFLDMDDAQRGKFGPILDFLSRGMYTLVKDVYEYGESLPADKQDNFSAVEDGLVKTAYSLFGLRKGVYKDFEKIYSVIANGNLSSDLHVPYCGIVFLINGINRIGKLEGSERDKAIELGDTVLRGMYLASESIYNPETDSEYVMGSGSKSDYDTDKDTVLPALAESFKK